MKQDDPSEWDWEQPRPTPQGPFRPVEMPQERSPFAPSLRTKLLAFATFLVLIPGPLIYSFRYELGLMPGQHAFMAVQAGTTDTPVTYQSCLPITYLVNPDRELPGGRRLIDEAVGEISAATGLRFVSGGDSDLRTETGAVPPGSVLVNWTDSGRVPELAGDIVGLGGSASARFPETGTRYYLSGEISLDVADLAAILDERGPAAVRAVILHEFGHVVGLDHVDDSRELMNEQNLGRTEFGKGDREGLERLGQGGCERQLTTT